MKRCLLALVFALRCAGATFYISTTGNDGAAGTAIGTAWATFAHAWTAMHAGDTLMVANGTYAQQVQPTLACTAIAPCRILAINDGKVIIDGTGLGNVGATVNFNFFTDWWDMEGFVVNGGQYDCNSGGGPCSSVGAVIRIEQSNHVTLRRMSGYCSTSACLNGNTEIFAIVQGNDNLIEDCIAGGGARKMIYVFGLDGTQAQRNIVRRCFTAWQEWDGVTFNPGVWPWGDNIESYNAGYNIFENNIDYGMTPGPDSGITIFGESSQPAVHGAALGNMGIRAGMHWDGSVMTWPCPDPFNPAVTCAPLTGGATARNGLRLGNNVTGDIVNNNLFQDDFSWGNGGPGFDVELVAGQLNEAVRVTAINDIIFNGAQMGTGGISNFDVWTNNYVQTVDTSGTGARLIYQYQSGFTGTTSGSTPVPNLTTTPLWPWPMESRVRSELPVYLSTWVTTNPDILNLSPTNMALSAFNSVSKTISTSVDPLGGALQVTLISDNTSTYSNSQVPQYSKFDVQLAVNNTVATNLQLPYDASPPNGINPGSDPIWAGISVDAQFSQNSFSTFNQVPCFYAEVYQDSAKTSWDSTTHEWHRPTGIFEWHCRFAPTVTGSWSYRVNATDSGGTAQSLVGTFTAAAAITHGPIGVSPTDTRYMQYGDGKLFLPRGGEQQAFLNGPTLGNGSIFASLNTNSINSARIWTSNIYGSAFLQWIDGRNPIDGYLPRAELEALTVNGSTQLNQVVQYNDPYGYYGNCHYEYWNDPEALEQNQNYDLTITYYAQSITGPAAGGSYGLVGLVGADGNCDQLTAAATTTATQTTIGSTTIVVASASGIALTQSVSGTGLSPGTFVTGISGTTITISLPTISSMSSVAVSFTTHGALITTYGGNTSSTAYGTITGVWNSGSNNFVPRLGVALRNVTGGKIWIQSISLKKDLGNSQPGPEMLYEPSMRYDTYLSETQAHEVEELVTLAEANNVALKLVLNDLNDDVWYKIKTSGDYVTQTATANATQSTIGATTIVVSSVTGTIGVGNVVFAANAGIASGTTVTVVSGTTITLSAGTTATLAATAVTFADPDNNPGGFYSSGRVLNKTLWIQQAWWRYAQARWGYSNAIHSWELLNEGDPFSTQHYQRVDEMGKSLHCRVFGITVAYTDSTACSSAQPNSHMTTTSLTQYFPGYFMGMGLWGNPLYPNISYADAHEYISTNDAPSGVQAMMEQDSALLHLYNSNEFYGYAINMPIVRGETAMDVPGMMNSPVPQLYNDVGGAWFHDWSWSGIDTGALYEIYWDYQPDIVSTNPPVTGTQYDHSVQSSYVAAFINAIPGLANGHWVDAAPTATSGLRVVGQKDLTNKKAYLWIQNLQHIFFNVVTGVSITPITGTVAMSGFTANANYTASTWNTYTGSVSGTSTLTASSGGVLTVPVTSLSSDTGLQIAPQGTFLGGTASSGPISISGKTSHQ